jgi:hypothetical protein
MLRLIVHDDSYLVLAMHVIPRIARTLAPTGPPVGLFFLLRAALTGSLLPARTP